jgi:acetylornithine deacetylase/succinyl-diaminopimelate desuccinylase-like protein
MKRQHARLARIVARASFCVAFAGVIASIGSLIPPEVAYARDHKDRSLIEDAPPPKTINYDKLTQEAVAFLQQYIRLNTTDPPGNELAAAKMIKQKFLSAGIPATVWEPAPGRGIIAARLRGTGRHSKALVLLSHMDVAPANPREWQVPPFSAQIHDGDIWGRGALDDKGPGVIDLMAMIAIKRAGILLNHDVIFIATGDEEEGGKAGAGWVVDHEADIYADAGYLLNQGGGIMSRPNGHKYYGVSVAEKTPLWIRLTATGEEGHAAAPPDQTAVTRLISALDRIAAYRAPTRVIEPVRDYFRAIGQLDGGPPEFSNLAAALRDPAFAGKFLAVPIQNALVRDTFTPTVLAGSGKVNIVPPIASAEIDSRLLPGENAQQVIANLRKVMADDGIKLDVLFNFSANSSPRKSEFMTALGKLAAENDTIVVPMMIPGFTDSHFFRQPGLDCYGFVPIEASPAEMRGEHGINERISVKEFGAGMRRMVDLLKLFGTSR